MKSSLLLTSHASPLPDAPPARRLVPVPKWNELHAWPPNGGMRHLIFHAKSNGFDAVIRRVGRRVLIDEGAFFDWIEGKGAVK